MNLLYTQGDFYHIRYLFVASSLLLTIPVASLRQSSRLTITSPLHDGVSYCLEVNAYANGGQTPSTAVREAGAVIDVWSCDLVETYNDYVNRDIIDHWVLGAKSPGQAGTVRHWVSGLCLSVNATGNIVLQTCSADTLWTLQSGSLQFATGACLQPDWTAVTYGNNQGFPLQLTGSCKSTWLLIANPLVVYPVPDPTWMDNYPYIYSVSVCAASGIHCYKSYAYFSQPLAGTSYGSQGGKSISWTTVSFNDAILKKGISVIVHTKIKFSSCVIAPRHLNIPCTRLDDSKAQFFIAKPMTKVSVEFDPPFPNDPSRVLNVVPAAMLFFADPVDDIPDPLDYGVMYFGPGYHDIRPGGSIPDTSDGCISLPANSEVYIAGGAYVVGALRTLPRVNNVTIRGRGVLTIEGGREKLGCVDGLVTLCAGLDLYIEGIATVDSQQGCISHVVANCYFQSSEHQSCNINPPAGHGPIISNIKVIGWQYATGIMPGRGAHVSDSFVRVNDDCNPDFQSNQFWERNILWQLDNGWPFMIQWNTNDDFEPALHGGAQNVTYQDTTVVHMEQLDDGAYGGDKRSVFGAWQGMPNTKKDLHFRNIQIEGGIWTALFMLYVGPGPFSKVPHICCGTGNILNLLFENIAFEYHGAQNSLIKGDEIGGGRVQSVNISGVTIYSEVVTNASFIPMVIDSATTSGIIFQTLPSLRQGQDSTSFVV